MLLDYLSIFQVPLCYLLGDMRQGQLEEKYFKQKELKWNLETAVSESFPEIDNFYRKKALLGGTEFTMQYWITSLKGLNSVKSMKLNGQIRNNIG